MTEIADVQHQHTRFRDITSALRHCPRHLRAPLGKRRLAGFDTNGSCKGNPRDIVRCSNDVGAFVERFSVITCVLTSRNCT